MSYSLSGSVRVAADVLPWLTTPSLMSAWMGVDSVAERDGVLVATVRAGHYAGWTLEGATSEAGARVERTWTMTGYTRVVEWTIGEEVACTVATEIPGLAASAERMGARAEQRGLDDALDRLRRCAEHKGPRLLGGRGSAGPL